MWKLALVLLCGGLLVSLGHADELTQAAPEEDLLAEASQTYATKQAYEAPKQTYEAPKQEYATTAAPSYSSSYAETPKPAYDQATSSSYQKRDSVTYSASSYTPPKSYGTYKAPAGYTNRTGYDAYHGYTPWRGDPGSYTKESYGGSRYVSKGHYSSHSVYASYLNSGPYEMYSKQCSRSYGSAPKISYNDLNAAFADALHKLNQYNSYEQHQYKAGNYMNASSHTSASYHQVPNYQTQSTAPTYFKEKEALFMEFASRYLLKHNCLTKLDAHYLLPQVKTGPKTGNPYGDNSCYSAYGVPGQKLHCRDSKYRTEDGSCNNLHHPYWGKAHVCHLRLVPPAYEDGIQKPRSTSYSGGPLPNPRVISTVAMADIPDRAYYTHMKMMFGQYVNHDITFTAMSHASYDGGLIKCCPNSHHPQCMPISIPPNDYQSQYKRTCMNFIRSSPCPLCTLGPRQQQNIATSFLDNGATYGSSKADAKRLRAYYKGLMRTQHDKCGNDIMPPTNNPWDGQCQSWPGMPCFDTGDQRVNQHPGLQLLHNLWLRNHNHHARHLARVNPKWGDERLYQEARRINVAQLQHITYAEYLPIVFGPTLMKYFDLDVNGYSGYTRYEPYTDPTTWNEYASAACRFGHSQISSFFSLVGYGGQHTNKNGTANGFWLRDWFFDPKLMYECQSDQLIKGFLHDHSMVVDPWITGDVHNYLFKSKHEKVGSDLPAFNIQRGRDHAIPPYHVMLKFCFGYEANTWDDIAKFIPYEQLYALKKIYKHPHDLDFWVAGISERKFPDADVGPTFACVLGIQYYHLKNGDRYFYSHGHQSGSFTPDQLGSIKKHTSLSAFLCHNGMRMDGVQRHAFFPVSGYNQLVSCKNQPSINYNHWKEAY